MKLTQEEKKYLFSKLEYKKKKIAIEKENDIFQLLTGDKTIFSIEDINKIIKSLEFTFRKRLIGDKPDLKNDIFKTIDVLDVDYEINEEDIEAAKIIRDVK